MLISVKSLKENEIELYFNDITEILNSYGEGSRGEEKLTELINDNNASTVFPMDYQKFLTDDEVKKFWKNTDIGGNE